MIPQTLNYADGGIRVAGLPDQAHPPRGTTARMADFARIEAQTRPMTTKTVSLMETRKLDVSVDPQNAPPPPPGAPAIAALGTMNLGTGSAVPAWVAFDGQTLNFEAFFVQPAVDGRDRGVASGASSASTSRTAPRTCASRRRTTAVWPRAACSSVTRR